MNNSGHKNNIIPTISAILLAILVISVLAPVIYVSKFAYPWSDDFSYSADAHAVFLQTHSVLKTLAQAAKTSAATYFDWQGTYTSCFLMALQPSVWGDVRFYHLTGVIMLGTLALAYLILSVVVNRTILRMPKAHAFIIFLLVYFASFELTPGIAEAFTWFNGAVHYTFNHAWLVFYVAMLALYLHGVKNNMPSGKRTVSCILVCILAALVAGGNNVTVFEGLLLSILVLLTISVYQKFLSRESAVKETSLIKPMLPVVITFIAASLINFLAPGNGRRMEIMGKAETNNYPLVILRAFQICYMDIVSKLSLELIMVLLIIGCVAWHAIAGRKALEEINFKFPLPGLFILMSFCLMSAMYTPLIYTTNYTVPLKDLYGFVTTEFFRVENILLWNMILFIVADMIYLMGWLYQKGLKTSSGILAISISGVAIMVCVITCRTTLKENPSAYVTAAAIRNLQTQTAQYFGTQMKENTNRLLSDELNVLVMPIAVDPTCLYPYDAEDWIEGTKLFYNKESVEYESEPYHFSR